MSFVAVQQGRASSVLLKPRTQHTTIRRYSRETWSLVHRIEVSTPHVRGGCSKVKVPQGGLHGYPRSSIKSYRQKNKTGAIERKRQRLANVNARGTPRNVYIIRSLPLYSSFAYAFSTCCALLKTATCCPPRYVNAEVNKLIIVISGVINYSLIYKDVR